MTNAEPAPRTAPASQHRVQALQNNPRVIPPAADASPRIPLIPTVIPGQNPVPPTAPDPLGYTLAPLSQTAVELNKGEKIGLATRENKLGEISAAFRWNRPQHENYSLSCFYELKDGSKDIIQILGNQVGSLNQPPYIFLDKGQHAAGMQSEDAIRINGAMLAQIRKIFIFTSNFNCLPNWQGANGELVIRCSGGPDVVIRLNEFMPSQQHCVIAALTNENDTTFSAEKIMRFFKKYDMSNI